MVNFGLLTPEIYWRVWGTPANFNGFRVLFVLRFVIFCHILTLLTFLLLFERL